MTTLLVLRHGKAGESDLGDRERELTSRGRHDATQIAKTIAERGLEPELIIASSAARARETARRVADQLDFTGELDELDELYLAEPPRYIEAVARLGGTAERVLVVGHNPGLEQLVELLTGEHVTLKTAALAVCSLACASFSELGPQTRGSLEALYTPKD
ncbi:MAG TPA: histidine phosphatase family protein [Polyangiaceae bacterium]|jgi:phosphohistidine phosphatase